MSLLELKHIQRTFNFNSSQPVNVLKNITFNVAQGEYVAIMGESGAGKSTLLNIIATLDKPSGGLITINGDDISQFDDDQAARFRRQHLGFVFQDFNLLDSLNNRDNVYLPLVLNRITPSQMSQRLAPLLPVLGIEKLLDRYPAEISGGQKQRIAIARALVTHPDLLLADEPTGALDSNTTKEILKLFAQVNGNGQTIIMVTHSAAAAAQAKRVLFLKDGRIYHELFKGDTMTEDYQAQINDVMLNLAQGGE